MDAFCTHDIYIVYLQKETFVLLILFTRFHLPIKFFYGEMKRQNLELQKRTVSVDSTLQVRAFRCDKTIIKFSWLLICIQEIENVPYFYPVL